MRALGFIGYGEVGQLFARQLRRRGGCRVAANDIKLDDAGEAAPLRAVAAQDGVSLKDSLTALVSDADIVLSAVTADAALNVAREAASAMQRGQIFFDVNSVSPATKRAAAAILSARGFDYVEGAVMAPVAGPGITVPILTGGARAAELGGVLNALGMNLRSISPEIGRASATKLCRSILIKGIEALIIDSARACRHWGVEADVFASLNASFQQADWAELATIMAARVARHGVRRAAEMREAARMLADLGANPDLAIAVADSHARHAAREGVATS